MAQKNPGSTRWLTGWFRKLVARPAAELARTGKITQTLFNATQLQSKKQAYLCEIGLIALKHYKEGLIKDIRIDRILAKIEHVDRVLDRQETLMKNYQSRGDVTGALGNDDDNKEPGI